MSKTSKILIAVVLLAALMTCICSIMIGALVYLADEDEKTKTLTEKAGVLAPKDIKDLDESKLTEEKFKNVKILYSEESINEKDYLKFLLETKGITDRLTEDKKEITIVLTKKIDDDDLEPGKDEKKKTITRDIFTYSGSYIYITLSDYKAFEDIHRAYRNLYGGILNAELFYGIPDAEIESTYNSGEMYNTIKNPIVQKYVGISGVKEEDSRWIFKTIDQRVAYAGSKFCTDIVELEELILCEAITGQTELSGSIPKEVREFLKSDLAITENSEYTSLSLADPGYADRIISQYKLAKAPFQYLDVPSELFIDTDMSQISNSAEYYKVKSSKINEIKKTLQGQGWVFVKQTTPIKNNAFGVKDSQFLFEKKGKYVNQELVIIASDTTTMKSDCISSATSKSKYCDSKAVYKNSGYVIQVFVGEKTNYPL